MDIVFPADSILTAVGMTDEMAITVAAVGIARLARGREEQEA